MHRKHAFRDLKPYSCTVGGKDCDAILFGDRESWFEHELLNHRAHYECSLCNEQTTFSLDMFRSHISTHHCLSSEALYGLQAACRIDPKTFRAQDCPFCDEWTVKGPVDKSQLGVTIEGQMADQEFVVSKDRFKRHVARHQEQLAIFAMPRNFENSNSESSGSVDDMSLTPSPARSIIKSLQEIPNTSRFESEDSPSETGEITGDQGTSINYDSEIPMPQKASKQSQVEDYKNPAEDNASAAPFRTLNKITEQNYPTPLFNNSHHSGYGRPSRPPVWYCCMCRVDTGFLENPVPMTTSNCDVCFHKRCASCVSG